MKVAIVGGGIFGGTIAWTLAKEGFSVDLYEAKDDIFRCTSGINQFRLHRGYHYPRSKETILDCLYGEKGFRKVYGDCVIDDPHQHYYVIAKENSLSSVEQCFGVWDECGLKYKRANLDIVDKDSIEECLEVRESVFAPLRLKEMVWERLKRHRVNVFLNKKVNYDQLAGYDLVVIATYAFNNSLIEKFTHAQRDYQFELIEKLVLKLPRRFANKSVVVQDGPFTCIDPLGRTGLTLMGSVVHAIHHRNIGKLPEIPEEFRECINNGIIKNPKITKVKEFLDAAEEFFPGIKKEAKHVGSMYTTRTVLPFREHDDARPTIVEQIDRRTVTVFSGKIPTCIDAAGEVLNIAHIIEREKIERI